MTIQAFQLVDKPAFRNLLQYLRPSLSECDIPHQTKTRTEIIERADVAVECVKDKLKVSWRHNKFFSHADSVFRL